MLKHVKAKHTHLPGEFKCSYCGYNSEWKSNTQRHELNCRYRPREDDEDDEGGKCGKGGKGGKGEKGGNKRKRDTP